MSTVDDQFISHPVPVTGSNFDHVTATDDLTDFTMALDKAIWDTFNIPGDPDYVPPLNGRLEAANDDFINPFRDVSDLNDAYSSSSALPESLMNTFDGLALYPSKLSTSNPVESNLEPIISLDGSEIQDISSTNNFHASFPELFRSTSDINLTTWSISKPKSVGDTSFVPETSLVAAVPNPDPPILASITNFDNSLAVPSGSGSAPNPPRRHESSAELENTPVTQTVTKPKFRRRNQVVSEGNNKVGRNGTLRCEACRKVHSKCKFTTDPTCCEYCKKHGISCVPRWGPKKEKSLQLAMQVPPPDDVVIDELDARGLHYLRTSYFKSTSHLNLVQKAMAFYGPTIQPSSLRFAILAIVDWISPFRGPPSEYLISAEKMLAKKPLSLLDEADLLAISLVSYLKSSTLLLYSPAYHRILDRLPSCSFLSRTFVCTMKMLLEKSGGLVTSYPFANFWRYLSIFVLKLPAFSFDETIWELPGLISQHFGGIDLALCFDDTKALNTAKSFGATVSDAWYWQSAFGDLLLWNARVATIGFVQVIQKDLKHDFARTHLLLDALVDVRARILSLEITSLYFDMMREPRAQWITLEGLFGPRVDISIFRVNAFYWTKLILALVLDGSTIQQATATQGAFEAALGVIFTIEFFFSSPFPMLASDHSWQQAYLDRSATYMVSDLFTATLVYPISQNILARNSALDVLKQHADPEISEMVQRYWSHPEKHFNEMLGMVFEFMKSSLNC